MTPEQFITTWKNNPLTERAGAQGHFDDLCAPDSDYLEQAMG